MPRDDSAYTQADADQLDAYAYLLEQAEARKKHLALYSLDRLPCTCSLSVFGMDVDLCPRHG